MKKHLVLTALASAFLCTSGALAAVPPNQLKQTEYHLSNFEKEVALQRGGEKMHWRSKQEALSRVQQLKIDYPDDPEVDKLVARARVALMKSLGQFSEVDPTWTVYKRNEEKLRARVFGAGKKAWDAAVAENAAGTIASPLPAPDTSAVSLDDVKGKYVVLTGVQYPARQFYGATGEYIWAGSPSEGYYFVDLGGRDWLGPYEAVKRYRRNVDSSLQDVKSWTMLGRITGITSEIPQAGESKIGGFRSGWVVTPVMLMVPDHVVAVHDEKAKASGRFIGEEEVAGIKESFYTVKSIPDGVSPEGLMEIFMTAIKEKNFPLFVECINPDRKSGDTANERIRYHWDLHQERFAREYVHATFGKARIRVDSGFDNDDEFNQFFLSADQKAFLEKSKGTKVESAVVESRALNEQGQQVGSPHPHTLIRKGGGRWYVEDYNLRF